MKQPTVGLQAKGPAPAPVGAELGVAVTAAFLTGCPLRTRIRTYRSLQEDLAVELGGLGEEGWSIDTEGWRDGGTYHSGGGFARLLPLVLARRGGHALSARFTDLLERRPAAERALLERQTVGWRLVPRSVRIDVYDLGVAVMNAGFDVRLPPGLGLADAARTLKSLVWLKPDTEAGVESPIAAALRELARESASQFGDAIRRAMPEAIQEPWLSSLHGIEPEGEGAAGPDPDEGGRLLWLHPVHLLEVPAAEECETASAQLAPPFHGSIQIPGGCFAPGIGWSAVVTEAGASGAEIPLRLIEVHWAYIALYMEIDRGLLGLLDEDRWHEPESLGALEEDADRVFANYMRVMHARARLDSDLASLGGDEFAQWQAISEVTKFDPLVGGVDRKVEVLQRIAERRVEQAEAQRSYRTSRILGGLTALTIVTVAVALIGNFLGTRSDKLGHIEWRLAIVALALLGSILVYWQAHRDRARHVRPIERPEP
jgi:hypothetical protein